MQTYGPFSPSSVSGWNGSGPWTTEVAGEGSTPDLVATGFNATVPADKQPQKIRFVLVKSAPGGNDSVKELVPSAEEVYAQQGNWSSSLREDAYELETAQFSAAQVNDPTFGLRLSGYLSGGYATFAVNSIAMYIEV